MTAHLGINSALLDEAEKDLARRRLLPFAQRVNPNFQTPRHIQYLATLLERVERGEIRRLALSAPPGHGKSTLLQAFVAWFIGRDSRRRVLAISGSERLAKRNSRDAQALVTSAGWPFDVRLSTESVLEWYLSGGGSVRAVGREGVVTGFRFDLILADDVQADAGSEATRDSDEDWFRAILTTRLEPNSLVVLIATRWHDADLIGRMMTGESRGQWMYVNLPAFAGEKDLLARQPGEALWPERWSREDLEAKREELTSIPFTTQYLGDPIPAGGRTFKPAWFEHRYYRLPPETFKVMAVDGAWKTGVGNDPSAIATWGTDWSNYFLIDACRGRLEFPELKQLVIEKCIEQRPNVILVEEAASGYALVAELRRFTGLAIKGIPPRGDKVARAEGISPLFESGKIQLPQHTSWLADWIDEHCRFPAAKHDDWVDTTSLALSYLHSKTRERLAMQKWREDNASLLTHGLLGAV